MSEDKEICEEEEEDTGVCANCPAAPDCDYASYNATRCWKGNR